MSVIENDFTYIGYPCFSKIANQLNNAAEIPEYTAFALSVLKTDNIEHPELLITAQEGNLLPESPIKGADLICFKEGITDENVFETLMAESRVKKHNNCTKYYKRFDTKLSLCKLCTRSPYYCNRYINEEYALLKFILSDRSNMQYFKELLKKYPNFRFMVSEDLAAEYRTKNTYVYESNAIFFECLKKHEDILYYSYNNYTIILKSSFSKAVKEGRRLPNTISQKENWSLVALDKILKRIDNAKDYSREEVEQLLIRWCEEEVKRKEQIKEYESKLSDNVSFGISTTIKNFSPKTNKSGQKRTTKKEETANKNKADIEKGKTPPFDPRNFVKFPDDLDNVKHDTNNNVCNIHNNKEETAVEQTDGALGEILTDTTAPSDKQGTTDTSLNEITVPGDTSVKECDTDTDTLFVQTNDANIPPAKDTVIPDTSDTESVNNGLKENTEDVTSIQEDTDGDILGQVAETEEYSADDLIFRMYDSNMASYYEESEEEYFQDDYYDDTNTASMDLQTNEKQPVLDNNEEITHGTDTTTSPVQADIEDIKITHASDVQYEVQTNTETDTSIVVFQKPAAVIPFKNPVYPDMEELDDTIPYREVELPPMERQLNLEQTITDELLEQCVPLTEDLVLLAEIETAILKERYFCLELVKDSKGNELFLFYVHKLHRYYYTRLDSKKVRDVFLPLFKMPSVKKYCYFPYYLYGYCACKELKIRSLFSIHTMQTSSTEDTTLSLGDLCVKYMPYGQQALKRALENASPDQWFYGIAYYRTIASKIKTDEKRLRDTNALDEVLGTSYLARRFFHTEDRLFILNSDSTLMFQNELYVKWLEKVRFNGYSVCYTVSAEKQIQKESIYNMLVLLSQKGYFKNKNIQLIALSNTTACFYISKEDFPYLDTIIQTYLFQYGKAIEEYHTNISYEYHTS